MWLAGRIRPAASASPRLGAEDVAARALVPTLASPLASTPFSPDPISTSLSHTLALSLPLYHPPPIPLHNAGSGHAIEVSPAPPRLGADDVRE